MRIALGFVLLAATLPGAGVSPAVGAEDCLHRALVLSAFPAELDPLLRRASIERVEVADGRTFSVGTLEGRPVVLALSGIGLVNAEETTRTALNTFSCDGDNIDQRDRVLRRLGWTEHRRCDGAGDVDARRRNTLRCGSRDGRRRRRRRG